jgi:hypothetical protein
MDRGYEVGSLVRHEKALPIRKLVSNNIQIADLHAVGDRFPHWTRLRRVRSAVRVAQRMVSVLSAYSACRATSESASFGTELAAMISDPSSSLTSSAVTVS